MCGIVGFNWAEKELLSSMSRCVSHRGPDQSGDYIDGYVSLGHRRLSIIDLSEKGRQPMTNEKRTVCIIFNGEIYNFKEIKRKLGNHTFASKSDTEVIVHAYEEFGTDFVNMLNGQFAIIIYDRKKKILLLARDRLGIKPLYYYAEGRDFVFASEIKAILKHPDIAKEINPQALRDYLSMRFVPREGTIIMGIKRMLPGHFAIYNLRTHELKTEKYWDIVPKASYISEKEAVQKFIEIFKDAVKKRLISDVPLGAYLSGGIDSSSVVAMMKQVLGDDNAIKTFSVGFGYGEEVDELKHAKLVSDYFSTEHDEFTIEPEKIKYFPKIAWHMDEPISDPAIIPVYFLSKHAKKKVTVVLTGDGGDEILAGYEQNKFLMLHRKLQRFGMLKEKLIPLGIKAMPYPLLSLIFKYSKSLGEKGKERAVEMLKSKDSLDAYLAIVSIFTEEEKSKLLGDAMMMNTNSTKSFLKQYFKPERDVLTSTLIAEFKTTLAEDYLMKADRMTLAHAVEERVPFLDHRLVEFCFTLPNRLKLRGWNEKYLLKKAMKDYVPKQILKRKKQRFYVPIELWIKKELKPVFENVFSTENLSGHPYFNKGYIDRLRDKYNTSPLFYGRQLWSIFSFEIWRKTFLEKERISI